MDSEGLEYATLDDLCSGTMPEEDHELADGKKIRVRGLSRAEVLNLQTVGRDNAAKLERETLARGVIKPRMTVESAAVWQGSDLGGGDIGKVMEHIRDLSALAGGAAREAYKSA